MVNGLDKFREYFKDYAGKYVIIGGTACDVLFEEADISFRATKDIDMILVIESLDKEFGKRFWDFIKDGNYDNKQEDETGKKYYRFENPSENDFPEQIELFSRNFKMKDLAEGSKFTPIPVDEDVSSLSAILLDEDYYKYTEEHLTEIGGLSIASADTLICLKAKAYLDLSKRKKNGEKIDSNKIKKHKNDVFRLAVLLTGEDNFTLPGSIKNDMNEFISEVKSNLPGAEIYNNMGLNNYKPEDALTTISNSFGLYED